jgi:hypothetical protein
MYELIISSPMCLRQYGRLPYVALAFLGRQPSTWNAASEGCHSTGQLVMGTMSGLVRQLLQGAVFGPHFGRMVTGFCDFSYNLNQLNEFK